MDPQQGQVPEENPIDGQAPEGSEQQPDVAELLKQIKELRKENAGWRNKLRTAEEAEQERKRSEMTELEKLKADLEAERQARSQAEEQRRSQLIRTQVIAAAARAGFNDPEDAYRMLDVAGLEVSDSGSVEGLDEALAGLTKSKPYLIKSTTMGTISPTNPAGGPQRPSEAQLKQELFGRKTPAMFQGGGVVWSEK